MTGGKLSVKEVRFSVYSVTRTNKEKKSSGSAPSASVTLTTVASTGNKDFTWYKGDSNKVVGETLKGTFDGYTLTVTTSGVYTHNSLHIKINNVDKGSGYAVGASCSPLVFSGLGTTGESWIPDT